MPYQGETEFYAIPYMTEGDILSEDEEKRRTSIIANLLYASTYGATRAIIEDPVFTLTDSTSDECTLRLSSAGSEYVFLGLVNYRLGCLKEETTFTLAKGSVWYIYASYTSSMPEDPSQCAILAEDSYVDSVSNLLLATVDYTGDEAVLDSQTGKIYMANLSSHVLDSLDPHGSTLTQTSLNVTSTLSLNGVSMRPSVIKSFTSQGETQVEVEVTELHPRFASWMSGSLLVKNVAISIDGDVLRCSTNAEGAGQVVTLRVEG